MSNQGSNIILAQSFISDQAKQEISCEMPVLKLFFSDGRRQTRPRFLSSLITQHETLISRYTSPAKVIFSTVP